MEVTITSSAALSSQAKQTWWRRIRWREQIPAYLFLLPALLIFGVFAWFPILKTVIFSFQNVDLHGTSTWIGLDNITRMLNDPNFKIAWQNSFVFASLSILIGFAVPIFVSIMINEMRHARA